MKKSIFFVGFFLVLSACAQHTSFLGPTYTIAKTGNIYQAGLTYESNKIIKRKTGKDVSGHLYEYLSEEQIKLYTLYCSSLKYFFTFSGDLSISVGRIASWAS